MTAGGPLAGVKVLDLTTTFSGPYCTLMLADFGADVVKVEPPGGDISRELGASRGQGLASIFLNMNRGKRSVVLDLRDPAGRAHFEQLLDVAEVVVHNMRPLAAERLGVDPSTCLTRNPRLVYCAIPGFSSDGPDRDRPAYDDVVQAASGMAHLQSINSPNPTYVITPLADKLAGLTATSAVLAALRHRDLTGEGQAVEVPMMETLMAFGLLEQLNGWTFEPPVAPPVYARTAAPNRRPYATADGHISVMVYTEAQWKRFFAMAAMEHVLDEPRFASVGARIDNADALYAIVAEVLRTRTTDEWCRLLEEADVPCARVRSYEDLLTDPSLLARGVVETIAQPGLGTIRRIANPVRFDRTPIPAAAPAPRLGQHTEEVLTTWTRT